jgi:hypothetical protein
MPANQPPVPEDLQRIENMAEAQLDAELRRYRVDPEQILQSMISKLYEIVRGESECIAELERSLATKDKQLEADRVDFLDLNEYWNGGSGAAVDACQHTCEVTETALNRIAAPPAVPPGTQGTGESE